MKELPDVHGDAVYGLAGKELATFANTVDLLIVGSRGYGPMKRMMLGSTSGYLERHARCSLLVLPCGLAAEATDEEQPTESAREPQSGKSYAHTKTTIVATRPRTRYRH